MANASLLEADRTSSPPTTGTSEPALAPGKRTLTDGMVVQRKLASDPSPAPAGGSHQPSRRHSTMATDCTRSRFNRSRG